MTATTYITADAIAGLMDLPNTAAFLSRRDALETDHGFPPPVPWARRPLKWQRAAVQKWLAVQGQPDTMTGAAGPLINLARVS